MNRLLSKTFLLFVFVGCWCGAHAQNNLPPVYEIKSDTALSNQLPDSCLHMLEDAGGNLTINEVANGGLNNKVHFHAARLGSNHILVNAYWFVYRLKNAMPSDAHISLNSWSEFDDFYIPQPNGKWLHYTSGTANKKAQGYKRRGCVPDTIKPGAEITVYQRIYNSQKGFPKGFGIEFLSTEKVQLEYVNYVDNTVLFETVEIEEAFIVGLLFLSTIFSIFFFSVVKEKVYLYFALFTFFLAINRLFDSLYEYLRSIHSPYLNDVDYLRYAWLFITFFLVQFIRQFFKTKEYRKKWDRYLFILAVADVIVRGLRLITEVYLKSFNHIIHLSNNIIETFLVPVSICITFLLFIRTKDKAARLLMIGASPYMLLQIITFPSELLGSLSIPVPSILDIGQYYRSEELICLTWLVSLFSFTMFMRYNQLRKENAQRALDNERLAKEKETERRELIELQNTELEKQVAQRTAELRYSLEELKSTQQQLIQSEKMASLGELTAGIAHEIQNPLNFVNNFSEVNKEMIDELLTEKSKVRSERNEELESELLNDIKDNEEKINHHGKRADAIVKGMLQHSRQTQGMKEPTDINALCDEYLRLSYHGLRAKDKNFNADFKMNFDESISKINIVPQDIGRVFLNLFNNAFYAISRSPQSLKGSEYKPLVFVTTRKYNSPLGAGGIEIVVTDNGNGIPQNIIDKIFQPFFTTKPTGEGTGLGLSLAYDIITKEHNGTIKVESKEGEGTSFIIQIPA